MSPRRSALIRSVTSLLMELLLARLVTRIDQDGRPSVDGVVKSAPAIELAADFLEDAPVLASPLGVGLAGDDFLRHIPAAVSDAPAVIFMANPVPVIRSLHTQLD